MMLQSVHAVDSDFPRIHKFDSQISALHLYVRSVRSVLEGEKTWAVGLVVVVRGLGVGGTTLVQELEVAGVDCLRESRRESAIEHLTQCYN